MTKTPKWLPDGNGIDPDSLNGDTVVETVSGSRLARHAGKPRPVWASVEQTAEHIGVSTLTVRRRIKAGEFRAYRVGKGLRAAIRLDLNEVDAAMRPVPAASGSTIVRVFADVTPPKPDPRRSALVAELLAALPESALSRSGADDLADTLLAALDAMGVDQ